MPTTEKLLTKNERLISPEDWEALNELFQECIRLDLPLRFSFETGRSRSDEGVQNSQGFLLKIGHLSACDEGQQRLYRSLTEAVADGWKILRVIATERYLQDTEI